jgi:hypothetical protein
MQCNAEFGYQLSMAPYILLKYKVRMFSIGPVTKNDRKWIGSYAFIY